MNPDAQIAKYFKDQTPDVSDLGVWDRIESAAISARRRRRVASVLGSLAAAATIVTIAIGLSSLPGSPIEPVPPAGVVTSVAQIAPATSAPPTSISSSRSTTDSSLAAPAEPVQPVATTQAPALAAEPPFGTWTSVIASLSYDDYELGDVEAFASSLDLPGVGVLEADLYPSLTPGFFFVFVGESPTKSAADDVCSTLSDLSPRCYARYLGVKIPSADIGFEFGTGIAIDRANGALVVISLETGEVLRVVDPAFDADGRFSSVPQIEGTIGYYGTGFEDGWFSCEGSRGRASQIDLLTGLVSVIGPGLNPVLSPDGLTLAYLEASQCLPDPIEPEQGFVVTPLDTIVLRTLSSGSEKRFKIASPSNTDGGLGGLVWDLAGAGLYVMTRAEGSSSALEMDVATGAVQVLTVFDGSDRQIWIGGFDGLSMSLVIGEWRPIDTAHSVTEISWLDPADGTVERIEAYEGIYILSFDSSGSHTALLELSGDRRTVTIDGVPLELAVEILGFEF